MLSFLQVSGQMGLAGAHSIPTSLQHPPGARRRAVPDTSVPAHRTNRSAPVMASRLPGGISADDPAIPRTAYATAVPRRISHRSLYAYAHTLPAEGTEAEL